MFAPSSQRGPRVIQSQASYIDGGSKGNWPGKEHLNESLSASEAVSRRTRRLGGSVVCRRRQRSVDEWESCERENVRTHAQGPTRVPVQLVADDAKDRNGLAAATAYRLRTHSLTLASFRRTSDPASRSPKRPRTRNTRGQCERRGRRRHTI